MSKMTLGIIGLGCRGYSVIKSVLVDLLKDGQWTLAAICDKYQDRIDRADKIISDAGYELPFGTVSEDEFFKRDLDAIIVSTSWEGHIRHAIRAMKRGIPVGMEVGGAYSIDDCWELVKTYEETKTPFMFLENCCYDKTELAVLKMVRENVFGQVVHCAGGYKHDLRNEVGFGEENRHYRYNNYRLRNCENYPTHELGPIANVLNINRGNRMVKLVSVASRAAGMREYMQANNPDKKDVVFAQGDVVNTIITCYDGSTISLTLDTTLPRAYNRGFTVCGTKGRYCGDNNSVFLEGTHEFADWDESKIFNNFGEYYEKYEDEIWKKYNPTQGHGGMDWLLYKCFLDGVREKRALPITVYDGAAWMAITPLSEQSIALGGSSVAIPDFTNGRWITPPDEDDWEFNPFYKTR